MPEIPITEATLRAAIRDSRYWQQGHPERQDFIGWVTRGFQALEGSKTRTTDGSRVVFVRAYTRMRNGKTEQVGAYSQTRQTHASEHPLVRLAGNNGRRPPSETPPTISVLPRGKQSPDIPPMPRPITGGGNRTAPTPRTATGGTPNVPEASATGTTPGESLQDILAPGGNPIGTVWRGSSPDIRTLPGGTTAAKAMFDRLVAGRGGVDVTPSGHSGQIMKLPDGSYISYRPISTSGSPAVDINIPGWPLIRRVHF